MQIGQPNINMDLINRFLISLDNKLPVIIRCERKHVKKVYEYLSDKYKIETYGNAIPIEYIITEINISKCVHFYGIKNNNDELVFSLLVDSDCEELFDKVILSNDVIKRIKIEKLKQNINI